MFDGLVVAFLATLRPVKGLIHVGISVFLQTFTDLHPQRQQLMTDIDSATQKQRLKEVSRRGKTVLASTICSTKLILF